MTAQQITLETMTTAHLRRCCRTVPASWLAASSRRLGTGPVDQPGDRRAGRGARCGDHHDDALWRRCRHHQHGHRRCVDARPRAWPKDDGRGACQGRSAHLLPRCDPGRTPALPKAWALSRLARSYSIRARHRQLTHRTTYPGARVAITHALWRSIARHMATSARP